MKTKEPPISREDLDAGQVDLSDVIDPALGKMPPLHPGEFLRTEFLEALGLTPYRLAKDIGVPPNRITEILAGNRGITGDTALRLARYFGTSAEMWLNLQSDYELDVARAELGDRLEAEITPLAA